MPVHVPGYYDPTAIKARAELTARVNKGMNERAKQLADESAAALENDRRQQRHAAYVEGIKNAIMNSQQPQTSPSPTPDFSKLTSVEKIALGLRQEAEANPAAPPVSPAATPHVGPASSPMLAPWQGMNAVDKIAYGLRQEEAGRNGHAKQANV